AQMTLPGVVELARAVERALEGGADGVVLTHGTDTAEEVAYALDLILRRTEPVVLTGAMRVPGARGADGPANLEGAVRVATHPGARDRGVLVVMNDVVH